MEKKRAKKNCKKKKAFLRKFVSISSFLVVIILSGIGFKTQIVGFCEKLLISSIENLGFTIDKVYVKEIGRHPVKSRIGEIENYKNHLIFSESIKEIYETIGQDPWIKDIMVHKALPDKISIQVKYKKAIAIHQLDSKFSLIDTEGNFIESIDTGKEKWKLPLVAGKNANKKAKKILDLLAAYPIINEKMKALTLIRERRWDLLLNNGTIVKLPEENLQIALESLEVILKTSESQRKTVKVIDMRVKDKVIFSGTKLIKDDNKKSIRV